VGKIAEKAVCRKCIFDNIALYFERRIDKNALFQTVFGDFAHWASSVFVFSSSDNLFNVRYVYFNKINSRTDCNI